jgi:multidrug efflux pump subunit AcrA (membrane-fusion protein)
VISFRSVTGPPDLPVARVKRGPFERKVRAEGVLKAEKATPLSATGQDMTFKIGWIAEDGARVKKGEVVVRFDSSDTEKALEAGEADHATAGKKAVKEGAESGAAIANLGRDADHARRELETARTFQSKDPELFSRHEIIEADIDVDLAGRREGFARGTKTVREGLSRSNLDLLSIEGRKASLKIGKAKKEMAALEVVAPHDGIVVLQRDWKGDTPQVGQTVWSGFPLAEIPDLSKLQAEVFVLEADAGGLAAGKAASVVVESRTETPVPAKVAKVEALAKPRIRGVPVQYFGATLDLGKQDPETMKPGQRVFALLDLGEEKNALSVPRQAVFEKEGKRVVYRKAGRGFSPVEVTLGASALGRVIVTAGLAEGDVIALADPEEKPKKQERVPGAVPAAGGAS